MTTKLLFAALVVFGGQANALTVEQWHADLDYVVERISVAHADPWQLVHKPQFKAHAADLAARLHQLNDHQITVEMMRLVALLQDGHSKLIPSGENGFRNWYPLRFHTFTDGIYITAAPAKMTELRGARVEAIAGRPAEQVVADVTALFGADNRFGRSTFTFLVSNADVLAALDLVAPGASLALELTANGQRLERSVAAEAGEADFDFRFWGEHFGPPGVETVASFGTPDPMDFLISADANRPLHLRHRAAYFAEHLRDQRTVYLQINAMTHQSSRVEAPMLEYIADHLTDSQRGRHPAQRLIVDLRYNFGGDGSMSTDIVNRLLLGFPNALERGHVFVITSGATFSAGVMLTEEILDHMPAILVGQPMGASWSSYGDAESFTLPESGFQLDVSRRLWQLRESDAPRTAIPVHIPLLPNGAEYFAGLDPAVESILQAATPYPMLDRVLIDMGAQAAANEFAALQARWGHLDYWQPVGRMDLEDAADALVAAGRMDDAIEGWRLNTMIFPDDWDTWDDLGQACLDAGHIECMREAYSKALMLNPSNWNAADQREALELHGE